MLTPSYDGSLSPMADHDPPCTPAWVAPELTWHHVALHKATAVSTLRRLIREGHDQFVNLCDGAWDEDRAGIDVILELERQGVAFTGSGSAAYEPTRQEMKLAAAAAGVGAPAGAVVKGPDDVADLAHLPWPRIVKHPSSYSSIGLVATSRVANEAEQRAQIEVVCGQYGAALVEEFIEGREATVLVADGPEGPVAWPPIGIRFPEGSPGFKTFDLKWREDESLGVDPLEPELDARIRRDAIAFYRAVGAEGYARFDVRIPADGVPRFLEINANPGLFYPPDDPGSADAILHRSPGGHRALLQTLLDYAVARRDNRRPTARVAPGPNGFGLVAARDIAAGEVVWPGEGQSHVLVHRAKVETWTPEDRDAFAAYAWPLTDDLYVMWHPLPSQWRPIDHACDPNTWLVGLDLVARRDVRSGTPLTMDYATFCGPLTRPFRCRCGAPTCREAVGPDSFLRADLPDAYVGHYSDYVARARRQRGLSA